MWMGLHASTLRDGRARDARTVCSLALDDQRLLRERCCRTQHGSGHLRIMLVRAHLHDLAPLPKRRVVGTQTVCAELGPSVVI